MKIINNLICGHAVDVLKQIPDEKIDCIITSPPYWSLRKYDIPDLVWDSRNGCGHEWGEKSFKIVGNAPSEKSTLTTNSGRGPLLGDKFHASQSKESDSGQFCSLCNAWRGQLGLEPTIELYLSHLLQCFDEVKRVLKPEGTLWVNLGDSYGGNNSRASNGGRAGFGTSREGTFTRGLEKSLCLIPERFAIAMVDRGWILRNKIVWFKRNCMPSAVKDRFTVDWENVFFFVKSRKYFFEQQYEAHSRDWRNDGGSMYHPEKFPVGSAQHRGGKNPPQMNPQGRNKRCVWDIPTSPYSESHFATFPEDLVEPMIRAGCPKEICVKCGKAREKIVENGELEPLRGNSQALRKEGYGKEDTYAGSLQKSGWTPGIRHRKEIGLTDCNCGVGFKPGICLDPFAGSGTVPKVAERLGRRWIGVDLGYQDLQGKRMKNLQREMF